jgi:pimeloyl-ACP methyl ester carboxylesterase
MNKLTLSDGRSLAYDIYGDPQGKPVFYFHGWPASRLSGKQIDKAAKKLGLKIISPDRPGYGYSTYKKGRTLLDWPDDVLELAKFLNLKKFSILGSSGGGPFTLACAYKIPNFLDYVLLNSGLGPIDEYWRSTEKIGIKKNAYLIKWKLLPYFASLLIPFNKYFSKNLISKLLISTSKQGNDVVQFNDIEFMKIHTETILESFRQGIKGALLDLFIYSRDWGFSIKDIRKTLYLFHGDEDPQVPLWITQYIYKNVKNSKIEILKNEGHYIIMKYPEKILGLI